jgi:F420H(2)-dependent quinone reductase
MPLQGHYAPNAEKWVQDQVELYERTDGAEGNTFRDTGLPIVLVTNRGAVSGKLLTGDERAQWWERAVAAYPPYAEYQRKTERVIPVFVLEPQ